MIIKEYKFIYEKYSFPNFSIRNAIIMPPREYKTLPKTRINDNTCPIIFLEIFLWKNVAL